MIKKSLLFIIPLLVGYLLGMYLPLSLLKPVFPDSETIGKAEYYRLLISILSAGITLCAVIVALFKDDLREYWKRPKIRVTMSKTPTSEKFSDDSQTNSSSDQLRASNYISKVDVENAGNLAALNTEIILEKLEFTSKDTNILQQIDCSGKPLHWNGSDSTSITLPVGAKKSITILSISAPEKTSTPDEQITKEPSNIIVGDVKCSREHKKGTWIATFTIYAQNHNPTSFCVEFVWNGVWKPRLTEFNSQFQIKLK
jgi:hypothetical protein